MTPQQVIDLFAKYVVGRYPCPSGVIAQLINEVGWKINTPKDMYTGKESYNLGNIKGVGTNGSVTILTTEYYNGVKTQVKAQFRAYHNYGEAIDDHFALLKKPRYVNAGVWKAKTPREYAEALQRAGYATDPQYVDKIVRIVDKFNLTKYDKAVEQKKPVPTQPKEEDFFMSLAMSDVGKKYAKEALDNMAKKGYLNSVDDWKKRVDDGSIYQELPWFTMVLLDRISDKFESKKVV